MRKFLSYAKSHIYEIHALIAATMVVILMAIIKGPIKRGIARAVDKKLLQKPELQMQRKRIIKQCNTLLIVLAMCLAIVIFGVLAYVSPLIRFSFPSAIMSGVFALCEYAVWEQITYDGANKS